MGHLLLTLSLACVRCLILILTCFIFSCLLTNIGSVNVCMTEVKKGTLQLRSHSNVYVFVLNIFVMKVLLFFLN